MDAGGLSPDPQPKAPHGPEPLQKHFLVTGATRGIGRAIALGFAAEGADVSICARDAAAVEETVATLRGMGVRAFRRALDVGDAGALTQFVQDAHAAMGRLDGLVASASPMASGRGIEDFDTAYRVDLMHTRAAVEAALPLLEKHGAITAISSISGSRITGSTACPMAR